MTKSFHLRALFVISLVLIISFNSNSHEFHADKFDISTKVDSINNDLSYFTISWGSSYISEFYSAVINNDIKFVGIMGFNIEVPGVPDYYVKYDSLYGLKIIKGTSDTFEDSIAHSFQVFCEEYARKYNRLLLHYISYDNFKDMASIYESVLQAFLSIEQFQKYFSQGSKDNPDQIIVVDDDLRGELRVPEIVKFDKPVRFVTKEYADSLIIGSYYWVADFIFYDTTARMQLTDPTRKLLMSAFFYLNKNKWETNNPDVQIDK